MDQLLGAILVLLPIGFAAGGLLQRHAAGPAAPVVSPLALARISFGLLGGGTLAAIGLGLLSGGLDAAPQLGASLGASAVGGLTCVLVALTELGPGALALRRAPTAAWVAGILSPVFFTLLGSAWMSILSARGAGDAEQLLLRQIAGAPPALAALAAAYAVLGAPVAEELLFRGALFGLLARRWAGWWPSLASGGLFGLLHLADPAAVPPLILMGVALGELRRRGGSLWPCIVAHAGNNVLAVALALV